MGMDYIDVIQRLKEERMAHGMSQGELGSRLRITQGHYSKIERAAKRLTYYEVEALLETELDMYYIYTGNRMSGKYKELFEHCSYGQLLCYLNMTASLFACVYEEQKLDLNQDFYKRLRCIRYITGAEGSNETVFYLIRQLEGETQFFTSERLGMDVKKFRDLERGFILPDSELIWKLFDLYKVPPAYVMKDAKGLICEIEYILDRPMPRRKDVIYRYFNLLRNYYKSKM